MPIYEYRCRSCDQSFEKIVLATKEAVSCPKCAGDQVEKQLSVFSSPGSQADGAAASGGCGCTPQSCGCH